MLTTAQKRADRNVEVAESELRAALTRREQARQEWNRAWGGVDNANAALDKANDAVAARFEDLCKARDAQLALIPQQREGK